MFTNLRYQLLSAFLFFSLIILSLVLINYLYIKKKKQIEKIHNAIENLNHKILDHRNTLNNFFIYDTKSADFFTKGYSDNLTEQNIKLQAIQAEVKNLQKLKGFTQFENNSNLSSINSQLDIYENYINQIVDLIKQRGYKDFGIEGAMRNYAHQLEDIISIDLSKVLMLRRHEKDYIIRDEEKYINKLLNLAEQFKSEISQSKSINVANKNTAIYCIDNYIDLFQNMVCLDKQIGIKNNTGLSYSIHLQGEKITEIFNILTKNAQIKKEAFFTKLKIYYALILIFLISLSVFLSIFLSKRITINLSLLSKNISKFVSSNFNETDGDSFPSNYKKDEIGKLIDNYRILRSEILKHINQLQEIVEKRTKALECQKERIVQQKEEIQAQRDSLFEQNKQIEIQKEIAIQQNGDIISSIEYAKRIQNALLPSEQKLERYFKNNFVLYKPKDIISGDFYWTKHIENGKFNISILAVADCTGHGVPGALMSMLGIAFLNEIVLKKEVETANQILDKLREKVIESLQSQSGEMITNDGMDIALILIDHNTNKIHFTGANRPLYFIRDKILQVIDGDKMPIGKHGTIDSSFTNHEILLKKNDVIYLLSDGYADQFGGPKNKKFKRKRLKDLLFEIHDKPLIVQKELLNDEHEKWQHTNRQTDDILILGVKF